MSDEFTMPDDLKGKSLEDIAKMYVETRGEYDKYKGEWEPRSKDYDRWSKLGTPDELEQGVNWMRTVAAPIITKITKGEAYLLNDADYKAYQNWATKTKNGTAQHTETLDANDELFAPVEKRLEEKLIAAANKVIDDRARYFAQQMQGNFKTIQDQLNLFGHVTQLQKQYPNLDFNELLKKGAEMAAMPADKLLQSLIDSETKLSGMEAEIDKRVAARIAEKETEKQNEAAKTLIGGGRGGGNLPRAPMKRADVMKGLIGDLGTKFPGIMEQIPLA